MIVKLETCDFDETEVSSAEFDTEVNREIKAFNQNQLLRGPKLDSKKWNSESEAIEIFVRR